MQSNVIPFISPFVVVSSYHPYDKLQIIRTKILCEGNFSEEIEVEQLEKLDTGLIFINGGLEMGVYDLYTNENGVYFETLMNDYKVFRDLGEVEFKISPNFVFIDNMDLDNIGKTYSLEDLFKENSEIDFFFNEFNMTEFTKEDFVGSLQNYVLMDKESISAAIRSLNDDFTCIISTYLPRYKSNPGKVSPENNIDCPFGELGFVDMLNKKTYRKSIPAADSFNPWVILAIIFDQAGGRQEIGLNELLTAKCNIGRIFNLDAITMLEVLHRIEKIGELKIIRTAGLDIIRLTNQRTFQECVDLYYANI